MTGWFWLQRRRDGAMRLGCFKRGTWRVADDIGRTVVRSSEQVTRLFEVVSVAVPPQ